MPAAKKKANCPVCESEVKLDSKFKSDYKGQTYYFCSSKDQKEFQNRPHVYAGILRVAKPGRAA